MWVVVMVLASCQDLAGETAKTGTVAEAGAYPSLHTVPPRPQLSYPVEQRRAIVDGLVADHENARYTSEVIRYRSGLSSIPPPERTTVAAVPLEVEPDPQAAPSATPSERPVVDQTPELLYEDDDLGSFLEDMRDGQVEEAPSGEPEARAAPSGVDPTPSAGPPDKAVARDGISPPAGSRIVPATLAAAPPEPARAAPTTTAAHERARISPSPAPVKPAPEGPTLQAGGDGVVSIPQVKPAPATAQIEVADGLVAIEVPPGDDRAMALASIAFGPGSAALPPDASARLERLLGEANAQGARVKIVGEADAPALALDRARAVGLALVRGGLPADRLEMTLAHDAAGDRARLFLAVP
jgi:outer membrane protein OmpA-like peptidoglycan-associated protein